MSLWKSVKNIRIEKRSKGASGLIDLVSSRATRFQTELVALRPLTPQGDARRALEAVISIMRTLPANVKGMEFWCNDAQQAFRAYVDAFVYDAPHAQQRKAPFIFLEDLKDILQIAESRMSMPMGVQTVSNLCLAARRTLIVQISALNTNKFDFASARSFETNKLVSASFDPLNIVERQVFDLVLSSSTFTDLNLSCVAELLMVKSHGNKSLAVCKVETTGQRDLMFPNFRGDEFTVGRTADTLTLTSPTHVFSFQSPSDQLSRWYTILRNFFDPVAQAPNSRNEYDSLGISVVKQDPFAAAERQMERDESYDSFGTTKSGLSQREISLNNLKRVSIGLPSGFTDDLKDLLKDLQEEEQERIEQTDLPLPAPTHGQLSTPSPSSLYRQASDEKPTDPLPTPTSLCAPDYPRVAPSPPPEKLNGRQPSKEEIERANEARRRIGSSIMAREMKAHQVAASSPFDQRLPVKQPSKTSLASSSLFANSNLVPCSESIETLASRSVPDVSVVPSRPWANQSAANSCESLPADISARAPPKIPPPLPSKSSVQPLMINSRATASLAPIDVRAASAESIPSIMSSETDMSSAEEAVPSKDPAESKKAKFKSFMKKLKKEMSDPKMARTAEALEAQEIPSQDANPAEISGAAKNSGSFEVPEAAQTVPAKETKSSSAVMSQSSSAEISQTSSAEISHSSSAEIPQSSSASSSYRRPLYALYKSTSMQSLNAGLKRSESSTSGHGVAVCSDSNNRTIAIGTKFTSDGSLASTAGSYQSHRSLASGHSMDTTQTSVGSTTAWESFLTGVKDEATKTITRADSDRALREETARKQRQEELKREEQAKLAQKLAAQEAEEAAASRRTLDPGSAGLVSTTEPVIRRVVESARQKAKEAEDVLYTSTARATSLVVPQVREIRTAKSSDALTRPSSSVVLPSQRTASSFSTNFSSVSTPTLQTSSLPPGMFSANLWVSKWTVSRWVPLSQQELKIELIPLGRGIAKVNITAGSNLMQLTVTNESDVRRSGRHDIQVRLGDETYMFRARASETANQFYTCISAARTHMPSLSSKDSDGSSTSSSELDTRRRTYVPPTLCRPRRSVAVLSSATILEEP